jgi:hypothetical protein
MERLLDWVLKSEKIMLPEVVVKALISASDGCPGIMLVKFDQVIDIRGEKNQLDAIENVTTEGAQIIDVCQRLMANEKGSIKWVGLSQMLLHFDQDPEQTRRAILGYFGKVLLGAKEERAKKVALMMAEFFNPYYDTGKAGLITSCFMACLV